MGRPGSLRRWAAAALAAVAGIVIATEAADAATLYISEFQNGLSLVGSTQPQIPPQPSVADQAIAVSGASAASAAFNSKTHAVSLICDEGCSISFGATPTATTSNYLLQQGVPVTFGVIPGQKVAVIANPAGNTGGGGGSTGTSAVDEAAFVAGATPYTPSGGFYQTTPTANALTNGQGGWFQMTANRAIFTNLRNASGTEVGTAAAPLQVSVANTGANGTAMLVTGTGGTFPVSGTVAVTQSTSPWIVAGGGTAGSAATGVATIQGIASMTPVQVSQATASNLNATVVGTGTFATQSAVTAASGAYASGSLASGSMVDLVAEQTPITPNTATATKGLMLGAQYNSTLETLTNGQQGGLQVGSRGGLLVNLYAADNNTAVAINTGSALADGASNTPTGAVSTTGRNYAYNGTTWDRVPGTTLGTYQIIRDAAGNARGANVNASNQLSVSLDGGTGATVALGAGSQIVGKVGIDQTTDVTTNGVEIAPTAGAAAGMAPVVSSALETGHVLKASAGNLYGVEVQATTVAGFLEVFNSTTVPAAGAVTPVAFCYVAINGTCGLNFMPPLVMATGISVAFSASTTPFTKTDSATAAFSGQTK